MGTSVSHPSPKTVGWKVVATCYKHAGIPIARTAVEVWLAAANEGSNLYQQLGSKLVRECVEAAARPISPATAAAKIQQLALAKENSIVGEFAKRALMIKAAGGYPREAAATVLFRQLTDYFVARDLPGNIGANYRCKTVAEQRALKEGITNAVAKKAETIVQTRQLASKNWSEVYPVILKGLQM